MIHKKPFTQMVVLGAFALQAYAAPVTATIDATQNSKAISPYIYGKNHGIAQTTGQVTHPDTIQRYKDAGFKMIRLNDGNNGTKYNWEKKLSSHPDWYNNVYAGGNNWDVSAQEMATKLPGIQGMYGLSLLGWVANNTTHNFNDWVYNGSAWWTGTTNDWAGTPPITAAGQTPTVPHDPTLYLEKRTQEQTLGIIDHFFGTEANQLALDPNQFLYWNLDNEPDIWNGTHSDVMPDTLSANEFVTIFVDMALKARAKFPNIKIVGPVVTNEWQWFNWHNKLVNYDGKDYSYMEFFIKRIGEEQVRTGKRLLDVVDYHFYPEYNNNTATDKANIMQLHRLWFDTSYSYPKANGFKSAFPNQNKVYIFERTRQWLKTYLGDNHGVTLGMTECGAIDGAKNDASVAAVWYASQLGEFASAGDVEVFTPWTQYPGMFEASHLVTQYAKNNSLPSIALNNNLVSVYPSLNNAKDSLTLIVVNRNLTAEQSLTLNLNGFTHGGTWAPTFDIANLDGETFVSATKNAVYKNGAAVSNGSVSIVVPKVSVTAIVLSTSNPGTQPTFAERPSTSSSSSSIGSSSSTTYDAVVWESSMGNQVQQPPATMGGYWYQYADPLSTITTLSAATIKADKSMQVVFTGVQSTEQNYNYAGIGFNWANTPAGANIVTLDLSAYKQICVEYKSTVNITAAIGQPSVADAKKATNYSGTSSVLEASADPITKCLNWADFDAATALNLSKQSAFQLQINETAELTVYKIGLLKTASSPVLSQEINHSLTFKTRLSQKQLQVAFAKVITNPQELQLRNLQGSLVRTWNILPGQKHYNFDVSGIQEGAYLLQVPNYNPAKIMVK